MDDPWQVTFFFEDGTTYGGTDHNDELDENKGWKWMHHQGAGYYNYPIRESLAVSQKRRGGTAYNYDVVVCFQADKTISLMSYFCCKSLQGGRNFSPEEVEYLLAMSGGTPFREVPTGAVQDLHVPELRSSIPKPNLYRLDSKRFTARH
jgi:hypothetical protein